MKWDNFTADRVASFKCKTGAKQSIFWDGYQPGLGFRVTAGGAKSYIFQAELHSKTIRITIGSYPALSISGAQTKAAQLKAKTDQGIDPRQEKAEEEAARQTAAAAKKAQEARETVTVVKAWEKYLTERKRFWSERHYLDHINMMQPGGEKIDRAG